MSVVIIRNEDDTPLHAWTTVQSPDSWRAIIIIVFIIINKYLHVARGTLCMRNILL